VTRGHDYFEVHEAMDVVHSAAERALIDAHVGGQETAAVRAASIALDATYTLLDGIERIRPTL
jgi:hypothetical protein